MSKKNSLLEEEIHQSIEKARYVEPEKEKEKKPIFYLIIVGLVTVAVIFSLLRYI
ncbi:TPA: hypothetical protein ACGOVD_000391 [Streptococcus suis]